MKLLQGLQSIRRRYRLQHVVANWRLPRLRSSGADKWACMISLPDAMIPWTISKDFNFVIAKISVTTEITKICEIRPKFH
jgi:hypothetical protein